MWGYIDEQKVILENILSLQRDTFSTLSKTFISPKEIIITASGTSLNAAMLVKCLIEKEADCSIIVENPFQLRYYSKHLYNPQNILIVISQSQKKPIFILICCVEKKMLVLKLKDIVQQY